MKPFIKLLLDEMIEYVKKREAGNYLSNAGSFIDKVDMYAITANLLHWWQLGTYNDLEFTNPQKLSTDTPEG